MLDIIPKANWVLFQAVLVNEASLISLPDNAKIQGEIYKSMVVNVGPDVTRCKAGDEVIVMPKSAIAIDFPQRDVDKNLRLVEDKNIVAVIQ